MITHAPRNPDVTQCGQELTKVATAYNPTCFRCKHKEQRRLREWREANDPTEGRDERPTPSTHWPRQDA